MGLCVQSADRELEHGPGDEHAVLCFGTPEAFNQAIGNWNTGQVTEMRYMFSSARVFNQPIGSWNTGKVTNMEHMFSCAYVFNQPIGNWNTGKVTKMGDMFLYASAFNQHIGSWNTSQVSKCIICSRLPLRSISTSGTGTRAR